MFTGFWKQLAEIGSFKLLFVSRNTISQNGSAPNSSYDFKRRRMNLIPTTAIIERIAAPPRTIPKADSDLTLGANDRNNCMIMIQKKM